jgi:hypothetical protein
LNLLPHTFAPVQCSVGSIEAPLTGYHPGCTHGSEGPQYALVSTVAASVTECSTVEGARASSELRQPAPATTATAVAAIRASLLTTSLRLYASSCRFSALAPLGRP